MKKNQSPMRKYYVVPSNSGCEIFDSWDECSAAITQRSTYCVKFNTKAMAEKYVERCTFGVPIEKRKDALNVYTDGSFRLGKAGYAFVIPDQLQIHDVVPFKATNNIAELYAIQKALEYTTGTITIHTDSIYSIRVLSVDEDFPANRDILSNIRKLMNERMIYFVHVRGHTGDKFNELADRLASSHT
jgi:ribonuclease HI